MSSVEMPSVEMPSVEVEKPARVGTQHLFLHHRLRPVLPKRLQPLVERDEGVVGSEQGPVLERAEDGAGERGRPPGGRRERIPGRWDGPSAPPPPGPPPPAAARPPPPAPSTGPPTRSPGTRRDGAGRSRQRSRC